MIFFPVQELFQSAYRLSSYHVYFPSFNQSKFVALSLTLKSSSMLKSSLMSRNLSSHQKASRSCTLLALSDNKKVVVSI